MKKILLGIIFPTSLFFSCKNNNNPSSSEVAKTINRTVACYLYAMNNDTIQLKLARIADSVYGTLNYLPYEKDARTGIFNEGKWNGDTLFVNYLSSQEGQDSDCEMAILRSGTNLVLTNDIWEDANYRYNETYSKGFFKDKSKISFKGDTLIAVHCKD